MKSILKYSLKSLLVLWLLANSGQAVESFFNSIPESRDRIWVGSNFWANRLQDWRIQNSRLECIENRGSKPYRTVHLLTRELSEARDPFEISVKFGLLKPFSKAAQNSLAGLLLGSGAGKLSPKARALIHGSPGPGGGYLFGVDGKGYLIFRSFNDPKSKVVRSKEPIAPGARYFNLEAVPRGSHYLVRLHANSDFADSASQRLEVQVPVEKLTGGIALFSHPGPRGRPGGSYWFQSLNLAGEKIESKPSEKVGPIVSAQHTLSKNILKLTGQLMPIGRSNSREVHLEISTGDGWKILQSSKVIVPGYTAHFRVPNWNSDRDVPYRLRIGNEVWGGTIRKDPVNKSTISVAGFTGNHNNSRSNPERPGFNWLVGLWYPHQDLVQNVKAHDVDVLFFSGDQIYEGLSPTGVDRPKIKLDYLYKWYLWCLAYRDLTRDIPSVIIPDDHDVYQGNLWGEGGRSTDKDDKGGYVYPADFVKMVERTQTHNLPDPFDPTKIAQGIGVYYTSMVYGRVSFAILEDRKFKTGCNGRVPPSGSQRADHITNPHFDVLKADIPGAKLLGDRQVHFLNTWVEDWQGHDMKLALSQTVFAGLATHHGPRLEYLRADLDSNGWPQSGRRRALEALRKGFVFHLAGDQHLSTLVHHGLDSWEDSIWSFAVPSVANFYPRKWNPPAPGENREPGQPAHLGRHWDGLMNRVTVYAATNPGVPTGRFPKELHDNMPGYGIVKLDKASRNYIVECWPRYANPRIKDRRNQQYAGWPRTIAQQSNFGRKAHGYLKTIEVSGLKNYVVKIYDEESDQLIYGLRVNSEKFRPKVFEDSTYRIEVGDPDRDVWKISKGEGIEESEDSVLKVKFP